jgi:8-oxo-dGTP pyrophosphatase MutT (NUDIX family)
MSVPRVLNPRLVPVREVDAHLPAVSAQRLTGAALCERFAHIEGWRPELAGDDVAGASRAVTHAAVLVALMQRQGGLQVLLTRRAEHLRDHAGQISFPGGRVDTTDADARATALREAQEEVGLAPAHAQVIGQLPTYRTVTGYLVTPVVALVDPIERLVPDPSEVAEVFEVPLSFLMNPAHHRRHALSHEGSSRVFLSMPWRGLRPDGSEHEYFIWGATAAMLRNLYRFLAD